MANNELIAPIVKAIQEQQVLIELMSKELELLKTKMKQCGCECKTNPIALKSQ